MSFGDPLLLAPVSSLLGVRPGMTVHVVGAPEGFLEALLPLPEGAALMESSKLGLDLQVLFSAKKVDTVEKLTHMVRHMAVTGCLWVCFPTVHEAPGTPTEDFVRLAALEMGLHDTKKVMLGPAWTALRLVSKPRAPRLELPRAEA